MKSTDELDLPEDCRYDQDHGWARHDGEKVRIGINDYAQDQLGEIVYVELPHVGDTFEKGEEFATVESVKAVYDLIILIGGEVIAINTALENSPQLMNKSPYHEGWMIDVKPSDPRELEGLMTKDSYVKMLMEL